MQDRRYAPPTQVSNCWACSYVPPSQVSNHLRTCAAKQFFVLFIISLFKATTNRQLFRLASISKVQCCCCACCCCCCCCSRGQLTPPPPTACCRQYSSSSSTCSSRRTSSDMHPPRARRGRKYAGLDRCGWIGSLSANERKSWRIKRANDLGIMWLRIYEKNHVPGMWTRGPPKE